MIFPSNSGPYKNFPPLAMTYIRKKMAGLSSLIMLAFAGFLPGLGMHFIFPFIPKSYHNINLINLTLVISCMGSLGLPVGNNFNDH
ncbi:hypothetical protein J3R83DRAFT_5696 [Lanmaoa asiatica]|nr:hypothetical protein J3R83DRAFT_5696 [Lanmaoa asiatica]